jgi:(p)ppGpp synthase/HD superfamily hydrolase
MDETQKSLREQCQFAKKLIEIDGTTENNEAFINEIKSELLSEHVYVLAYNGKNIELPNGSTALDFACQEHPDQLDKMTGIIVNGKEVSFSYVLKNNDCVQILTTGKISEENLENCAYLESSRQKIKKLFKQRKNN